MNDRLQAATTGGGPARSGFMAWVGGRATRKEYWIWMVPLFVIEVLISGLGYVSMFLVGVPRLLILIRRLHDLGWTGWLAPALNFFMMVANLGLTALVGAQTALIVVGVVQLAVLAALGLMPGEARANEFGPPPGRKGADLQQTFG